MQSYTKRYKLCVESSEMAILLQRKSVQEEGTAITSDLLTPESLKPFLTDCGYQSALLVDDYQYETVHVPLAAFATSQPTYDLHAWRLSMRPKTPPVRLCSTAT